jgi:hypothetical protein
MPFAALASGEVHIDGQPHKKKREHEETEMKRLILGLTAVVCVGLSGGAASAANPYRDRHFAHYALHDAFDLQDFHRHSYAAGYTPTWWSREATIEQVTPVPPVGELPPVPLPPEYEHRRRDYEYYRSIMPGSPASYRVPAPPRVSTESSPSDIVLPLRSRTPQPGR